MSSAHTQPIRFSSLIPVLYVILPVITPAFDALDTNGPGFLSLALLNIFSLGFLFWKNEFPVENAFAHTVFRNRIGTLYALFILFVFLSFSQSINLPESIIAASKLLTVFIAAFIISIAFRINKEYLLTLCIAVSSLLIIESILVLFNVLQYITGKLDLILEIKLGYFSKNILNAALFVKIPFALWLASFSQGKWKNLGLAAVFLGFLSVLFLSSRAFYVGILFFVLIYLFYTGIRYFLKKEKKQLHLLVRILGSLILAFILFTLTQKFLYPKPSDKKKDIYNRDFVSRLALIKKEPGGERLPSWKRSFDLIQHHPLLGVGIGNWKIRSLEEANKETPDFVYHLKNHNDFIEMAAETGLAGGLLYLSVFVLVVLNFARALLKKRSEENEFQYLFFPAMGLLFYGVDAFFNFPIDRSELASLFAVFAGAGIAFSSDGNIQQQSVKFQAAKSGKINRIVLFMFLFLSAGSTYALYQNFISLRAQKTAFEDQETERYARTYDQISEMFPSIPSLTCMGEPVAVAKARHLFHEKKYERVIELLRNDRASPYDTRREYFMAMSFYFLGKTDSAFHYAEKVRVYKPWFFNNLELMCTIYESRGERVQADSLFRSFFQRFNKNKNARVKMAVRYAASGSLEKALIHLDTAATYFPNDTFVAGMKMRFVAEMLARSSGSTFKEAVDLFNSKKYEDAIQLFTELIDNAPFHRGAMQNRAYAYNAIREYAKSNEDIGRLFENGFTSAGLYNLRGVNLHFLGNDEAACSDFKLAMEMQNNDGRVNYDQFCMRRQTKN